METHVATEKTPQFKIPDLKPDLGEISTDITIRKLTDMAHQFSESFRLTHTTKTKIDNDMIEQLASAVNGKMPFYDHAAGIATVQKQLEDFEKFQLTPVSERDEKWRDDLMMHIDCKLSTTFLGFVIKELASNYAQDVKIQLITRSQSPHPALMVEINEKDKPTVFVINFNTRPNQEREFQKSSIQNGVIRLNPDEISRARVSVDSVRQLDRVQIATYRTKYFYKNELNLEGLQEIDNRFIRS